MIKFIQKFLVIVFAIIGFAFSVLAVLGYVAYQQAMDDCKDIPECSVMLAPEKSI